MKLFLLAGVGLALTAPLLANSERGEMPSAYRCNFGRLVHVVSRDQNLRLTLATRDYHLRWISPTHAVGEGLEWDNINAKLLRRSSKMPLLDQCSAV
jgi:hypothetical protein